MQVGNEELLLIQCVQLHMDNSFYSVLDYSQKECDADEFISVIQRCQAEGIIHKLISRMQLINVPKQIEEICSEKNAEYWDEYVSIDTLLDEELINIRRQGARCFIGGSYAVVSECLANGDVKPEIILYIDRAVADCSVKTVVLEDKTLFDSFYMNSKKRNVLPYNELIKQFMKSKEKFCLDKLLAYVLGIICNSEESRVQAVSYFEALPNIHELDLMFALR